MLRFRKGELQFYKTCLPKELTKYCREHPENKPYVEMFLDTYKYDYAKEKWVKKGLL